MSLQIATQRAAEARRRKGIKHAEQIRWFIEPLCHQGRCLNEIARMLNAYRIKTPTGVGQWNNTSVTRMVNRLGLSVKLGPGGRPRKVAA